MTRGHYKLQVYLDEVEEAKLRSRAGASGRAMAALVREAVSEYLAAPRGEATPADDPIWGIAGSLGGAAGEDGSVEHDHYLYGARKKRGKGRG